MFPKYIVLHFHYLMGCMPVLLYLCCAFMGSMFYVYEILGQVPNIILRLYLGVKLWCAIQKGIYVYEVTRQGNKAIMSNLSAFAISNASKAHLGQHRFSIFSKNAPAFSSVCATRVKTTGSSTDHCSKHKQLITISKCSFRACLFQGFVLS